MRKLIAALAVAVSLSTCYVGPAAAAGYSTWSPGDVAPTHLACTDADTLVYYAEETDIDAANRFMEEMISRGTCVFSPVPVPVELEALAAGPMAGNDGQGTIISIWNVKTTDGSVWYVAVVEDAREYRGVLGSFDGTGWQYAGFAPFIEKDHGYASQHRT